MAEEPDHATSIQWREDTREDMDGSSRRIRHEADRESLRAAEVDAHAS